METVVAFIISIAVLFFLIHQLIVGIKRGKILAPSDAQLRLKDFYISKDKRLEWIIIIIIYFVFIYIFLKILLNSIK